MADANCQIGLNYQYKSDYPKALEYFFKALNHYELTNNKVGLGIIQSNIGVVYQAQGDYNKALLYAQKSLEINKALNRTASIASDLGNIGVLYLLMKDYKKALEYDNKSLQLFEKLDDKEAIANNLGNIANVYNEMGDFDQSLDYNQKALKIFEHENIKVGIANTMGNMGVVFLNFYKDSTQNYSPGDKAYSLKQAIEYITKALAISDTIGQLDNIIEFSIGLSEAYELSGNHKAALAQYKRHAIVKDSVYSAESKMQIAQLESKEFKDRQLLLEKLEVLKKRDERIAYISGIAALIVILLYVTRRFNKQKKYNTALRQEKQKHLERIQVKSSVLADIASMQSHEIRGNVASILGLVREFNKEDATDPTNKFVIDNLTELTEKLDKAVRDVIKKENEHRETDA
jgi:tetratricopeptide (TPR) repeat protein